MKTKLISKGTTKGLPSAMIIQTYPAKQKGKLISQTLHLIKQNGVYTDNYGSRYPEIK